MAQIFALIAPVQPILHRVSCSNETLANAPKYNETHQNMSLGSNGVDRVRSLRKILMRLRGTKFCTSSDRFAPSFLRQPNRPKCTHMVWNSPKHEFRVQWSGSGAFVAKIPMRLHGTNFCTSSARFAPSFVRQPKDRKSTRLNSSHYSPSRMPSSAWKKKNYPVIFFWFGGVWTRLNQLPIRKLKWLNWELRFQLLHITL